MSFFVFFFRETKKKETKRERKREERETERKRQKERESENVYTNYNNIISRYSIFCWPFGPVMIIWMVQRTSHIFVAGPLRYLAGA